MKTGTITIKSSDEVPEFIDITDQVQEEVKKSEVQNGQVLVFAKHSTAGVIIQEPEEYLKEDFRDFLKKVAPKEVEYKHSNSPDHILDKMPNGHSHLQHLFLGSSEVIPFTDGELMLGTYQRIYLVELDRARTRSVIVQVVGD
ncbi:MAG: secondary thiamine-phosphate synthase enzyme YjbQ [bacterium]|nr:secondary thiamine-phosphate synthase enzyme YjbQ [bacterium]